MIIGTAGHIDHGKSRLLEALTGRRMDPLAEEQRRGITLDLHFASLDLGDGVTAGVVDVPGHEDLVRTMVAGAAGGQDRVSDEKITKRRLMAELRGWLGREPIMSMITKFSQRCDSR